MAVDPRTPVLVGVGVASVDAPVLALLEAAALAAATDAGASSLLGAVQWVAVPKGTWPHTDPGRVVAPRAHTVLVEVGVPQQVPVNEALTRIRDGGLDVALIVGGEAKAHERTHGADEELADGTADEVWRPSGELVAPAEVAARVWAPVQQYAVIENALRAAEGRTITEHVDELAALWQRFMAVAAQNPYAAFPNGVSSPDRPLAFPYAKQHSTQWTVDQAGALLLCSAEAADAHGVPRDRWLFPWVALHSSHALSLSRRRALHRWPAMAVLGDAAAAHVGRPLRDIEHTDLYSCFPSAVRVQQRELHLPLVGTPTVTGGMAFAGGPFNNYTYQSTAAVAERLRAEPDALGMVTTVSGLLTKPGLAVWSASPPSVPALIADLADAARQATQATPTHDVDPGGSVRVAGYTVTYDETGAPGRVVVIGDAVDDGARVVRVLDDPALAAEATRTELVERVLVQE